MIELDGIQYSVNTPEENTTSMVNFINDFCASHDIRNSKNELISIEANTTNPMYMIIYGLAYLVSAVQRLIYNVGCTFSISSSSDRQLLNLATLAGVKRKGASYTVINCIIYASRYTDTNPQSCEITTSLSKTLPIEGSNIVFHPAYDITIGIGQARLVPLVAETLGSYSLSAGLVTSFDTPVPGLRQIKSEASIPGREEEKIEELRIRLQNKGAQRTQIDSAIEAIEELPGVIMCNILFNQNPNTSVFVGDIEVEARKALLLLQGYNDKVAETYYKFMTSQTVSTNTERLIGGGPQYYVTEANQQIPVYLVSPQIIDVYIQVYITGSASLTLINSVTDALLGMTTKWTIGQGMTTADVINTLKSQLPELEVQGAYISLDGSNFSFQVTPPSDGLLSLEGNNITVRGSV